MENQLKKVIEVIFKALNKPNNEEINEIESAIHELQDSMINNYNKNLENSMFEVENESEIENIKQEIKATKEEIIENKIKLKSYEEILKILYS